MGSSASDCRAEGFRELDLLDMERTALTMGPSVSCVTFYSTPSEQSPPPTKALLRQHVKLVASHPWLAGRLVKPRGGKITVRYPISARGLVRRATESFSVVEAAWLQRSTPYQELSERLWGLAVKPGADCLDREDEPLFRVVVLLLDPKSCEFGVLVSLSHVLGDAFTLYELHARLSPPREGAAGEGGVLLPLEAAREQRFPGMAARVLGEKSAAWGGSLALAASTSLGAIVNGSRWAAALTMRAPPRFVMRAVKREALQGWKREAAGALKVPFVSANDVLSSWFLGLCRPSWALVVVNCRPRLLGGLLQRCAGNYLGHLVLQAPDYATPAAVRRAVESPALVRLPGCLRTAAGPSSLLSNWESLFRPLEIPGCRQRRHFPLLNASCLAMTSALFVFHASEDEVGMLMCLPPRLRRRPSLWPSRSHEEQQQQEEEAGDEEGGPTPAIRRWDEFLNRDDRRHYGTAAGATVVVLLAVTAVAAGARRWLR